MPYIVNDTYHAKSFNQRINALVLHYTARNFEDSLKILTEENVSSHYLIPEGPVAEQRILYRLVEEPLRAWHAGVSYWQERTNLNDTSIGIEIVNLGFEIENGVRHWFPFSDYQIETVIELAKDIINRYQIEPTCVVAHADIAPDRKEDPGPLFPWKKLFDNGIGAWYNEAAVKIKNRVMMVPVNIQFLQKKLKIYGYNIKETGIFDEQTKIVLQAFQMHFRPSDYSGNPDPETYAILESLVERYFPSPSGILPSEPQASIG